MPIKAEWTEFRLENIRLLPSNLMGVYECGYKRGNKVLYIGEGNIRANLIKHTKETKFVIVTHFRKRKTDDHRRAEGRLMDEYRKAHNGKIPILNVQKPTAKNPPNPYVLLDKIKTVA